MSRVPLKRLATVIAGQSPPSVEVDDYIGEGLPFLQGNAEFGHRSPTPKNRCDTAGKRARAGDLLVSVRAPVGALNWSDRDYGIGRGLAAVRPGPGLDPGFCWWWLHAAMPDLRAEATGSTYEAVTAEEVCALQVPERTVAEQRTIAEFLDTETDRIDALIAKKRSLVRLLWSRLDAVVSQATRASLAGNANDVDAVVPPGWRRLKLSRCFSQYDYGIGESSRAAGQVAVLGMGNVNDRGGVVLPPNGYVDFVEPELLLATGDLLFNRTNSLSKVGKVALVETLEEPTTFASYLVRLRVGTLADERYLRHFLNSRELLGLARASALPSIGQANLNPARYGGLDVAVPPIEEQRVIAEVLDHQTRRTAVAAARLEKHVALLKEHRHVLITAAVTGELNIPGVAT